MQFRSRVYSLLYEKEQTVEDITKVCGVTRWTIYRGVKTRSTLCALAYFFGITVEELVRGTDAEKIWYTEDRG